MSKANKPWQCHYPPLGLNPAACGCREYCAARQQPNHALSEWIQILRGAKRMMQMPRLTRNRPAPLCTACTPTRTEARKQVTAQLERHPDPYVGGLEPASCRALPDDHTAALARMASKAATLEAIRKLCSALLATPILHIPCITAFAQPVQ